MRIHLRHRIPRRTTLSAGLALAVGFGVFIAPPVALAAGTTFVVNKNGDAADLKASDSICDTSKKSGKQCTLRAAIQQANATGGANVINFNLPAGSLTIAPKSALPAITDSGLDINGYSQPGSARNSQVNSDNAILKVVLDGVSAGSNTTGLVMSGDSVVVEGLDIARFGADGIDVYGSSAAITGNFIGTDVSGSSARSNFDGIFVDGPDATIGGSLSGRNLISGNGLDGLRISAALHAHGDNATASYNFIGVNKAGTVALHNGGNGISVSGLNATIGSDSADGFNLISGNGGDGIHLLHANGCQIMGNIFGTSADHSGILSNGGAGISIQSSSANEIGPANYIARNTGDGVFLEPGGAGTEVQNNAILSNGGYGVEAQAGSESIHNNLIQSNGKDGIAVTSSIATGVQILDNSEVQNTGLGINLVGGTENSSGVTSNDTGDGDTGANNLQNFPVITSAVANKSTNKLTVGGTLNSAANEDYLIEVFMVSNDPSGSGEGQSLVGSVIAHLTTSNGTWTVTGVRHNPGLLVTATATFLEDDSTSEYSSNFTITGT